MQLGVQLPEASGMFAGVVTAEEQLSSGRENGPHRGGGAAAVAAVLGGQGRRSGEGCVHDDLPSSGPFGGTGTDGASIGDAGRSMLRDSRMAEPPLVRAHGVTPGVPHLFRERSTCDRTVTER